VSDPIRVAALNAGVDAYLLHVQQQIPPQEATPQRLPILLLVEDILAAADKARAVTDEEVASHIEGAVLFGDVESVLNALRNGGLKVMRA
jgi:hypothetical protein